MQRAVSKLFKLAKMGQRDEFNVALANTNILNNLQYLNGRETSMLIYSLNKLKLIDQELQSKLESLYLAKTYNMNIHDNVMCGWSLKNTKNHDVKVAFINSVNQNWPQIKEMQETKANIGLIAYLAAQENNSADPIWNQIEQVFEETMEYQDERNFMTILYAYSKIHASSKTIWILLEKYAWGRNFSSFSNRNKVLMVYSFAKAGKGSMQFWEAAAKCLQGVSFKYSDDISFCIWSFAKVKYQDKEFWNSIIDKQVLMWNKISLSDIENTTWALETMWSNDKELWNKILNNSIQNQNSDSNKYSNLDELLTIGKRFHELKMENSNLFNSAKKLINDILKENSQDFISCKKFYYLIYYIKSEGMDYCQKVIRQMIEQLKKSKDEFSLDFFHGVTLIAQDLQLTDKQIYSELSEIFRCIKLTRIQDSNNQANGFQNNGYITYFWAGSNLIQYSEKEILSSLTSDEIFNKAKKNIPHLCNMIKILSKYDNTQKFFEMFRTYQSDKPDVFINLFLNMLHKHQYLVPQACYKHALGILKTLYLSNDKEKYMNQIIDLMVIKNGNFIGQLKAIFGASVSDFVKQFDGTIEVQELKHQQEQLSRQRLEFHQQVDFNNQQFIDIAHRKIKNQFD